MLGPYTLVDDEVSSRWGGKSFGHIERKLSEFEGVVSFESALSEFIDALLDEGCTLAIPDVKLIFRHNGGDVAILLGDLGCLEWEPRQEIISFIGRNIPPGHYFGVVGKL